MLAPVLVEIAVGELGVTEVNGTNCGPRVNEYKAATNLPAHLPWPWCAAFIDWLVMQAMLRFPDILFTFKRPTTAGAWDLINWSLAQDNSTQTKLSPKLDIKSGDIVVYTFSHCGLAKTRCDSHGYFEAIEGNTDVGGSREGGEVGLQLRHYNKVRARIRFTV